MRAHWVVATAVAILSVGSPSAQQSHLDIRSQIEQMTATFTDHYNKQDAVALASMFTQDALRVSSDGTAVSAGPQAIEGSFNTQFKTGFTHIELMVDEVSPLGVDAAVTIGQYHLTGEGLSSPLNVDGRWSEVEVREGGEWKIRLLTVTTKTEAKAVVSSIEANATAASPESKVDPKCGILRSWPRMSQRKETSATGGRSQVMSEYPIGSVVTWLYAIGITCACIGLIIPGTSIVHRCMLRVRRILRTALTRNHPIRRNP
jgi:uncharacterized protein (TIGR02246 family)